MHTVLKAAATTYPRPLRDTRHGLHANLAFGTSNITTPSPSTPSTTMHNDGRLRTTPLPQSPYSKTPRTRQVTISPGAIQPQTPPPPPPSMTSSPPSGQGYKKRKPHNNQTTRCPKRRPRQPHRNAPTRSPSHIPSPGWNSPRNTAPPWTATGLGTCHENGQSTMARSGGTKSYRDSKSSATTALPNPATSEHYQQTATTLSSPFKGMPPSYQPRETP